MANSSTLTPNRRKRRLPDFPSFQWKSIEEEEELGSGTFGSVSLASYEQRKVVVKKMKVGSAKARARFEKEAGILFTVREHENISKFLRFCPKPYSIMMEYSSFDFRPFGLEDKKASALNDFLYIVDEHCNFVSFEHFIPVCARDVLTGLEYLHSQGIAHRDLKPSNVLVCNQHYITKEDSDDLKAECPIVCKLADFGLSRSLEMQTNSTLQSTTDEIHRGTPIFMAPEVLLESLDVASQEDLVKADMWSLGFIMYALVNPNISNPYRAHFKQSGIQYSKDAIKASLRQKQLPSHDEKYESVRIIQWWQLEDVFMSCAKFDPSSRPTAAEALCLLDKNWLKTSLSFVNLSVGMNQSAGETPGKEMNHCATFVTLSICDQFLKKLEMKVDVPWEGFKEIVENAITSLPSKISKNSADSQQYDVFEAKTQLKELNILSCDYELTEACVSGNAVFSDGGRDDVINALADKLDLDRSSIAIYTCSSHIFLVGKHNDALFLVDLNGLLITTPDCSQQSRHLLTQWILTGLFKSGVSGKEFQSIIWVTPIKD